MPAPPDPSPAPRARRPLRILLAEDNLTNQKLTVCLLQKHGHSVLVAPDGQQAVEAAGRATFDLILMDVHMPVMNGLEATAVIRDQQRAARPSLPSPPLLSSAIANAASGPAWTTT
jgi:CheY-like chemotaxis protein